MQPPNQHSRINLADLKAQIVRKLGAEGSKQYFYYLQKFLSLKLNKAEFDKLCLRILGRENVPLHNQFIRSILINACSAKSSPPIGVFEHGTQVGSEGILANSRQQNGSHVNMTQISSSPCLSNGNDVLPVSPRKARTGFRDRRSSDRRSALGPNGRSSSDLHLSAAAQLSDVNIIVDNGELKQSDIGNPMKMSGVMRLSDGSALHVHSKDQNKSLVRNDREDASGRSPLRAPLGVPLCPVSVGGARKALPPASNGRFVGTLIDNALSDSLTLRERMENIAVAQGLDGVSPDCANVLNHGLDSYIKGLIRSCIQLVGTKSGQDLTKNNAHKHENHTKLINGVKTGLQYEVPEQKIDHPILLQDFRVSMELNPRQLGEDWPLLLDKICTRSFEE